MTFHKSFSSFITPHIRQIPASGIREVLSKATQLENQGRKIIHLEVGQPNFQPPAPVIESTIAALRAGHTTYIANNGMPDLRQTISDRYTNNNIITSTNQIIITTGSMLSMYSLFAGLLQPDDECLVPLPGFGNYLQAIAMVHAKPVPYITTAYNKYLPTLKSIEKMMNDRTKCMVICNPGNPTGAVFNRELIRDIVQLTRERGVFLVSDEIYGDITFDEKHVCAAEYDDFSHPQDSHIAVVAGVSKSYAMTGYRVGWTRCSPTIVSSLTKIQEPIISCGVPFAQIGANTALQSCSDHMIAMRDAYKHRRDIAVNLLAQHNRPCGYIPGGAFYLPIDISTSGLSAYEFTMRLLDERGCAVAPGTAFDTGYMNHHHMNNTRHEELSILNSFVRLSLANSDENVKEGINLICDFLDHLEKR